MCVFMGFIRERLSRHRDLTSTQVRTLFVLVLVLATALRVVYLQELPIGFSHQSLDHHTHVTFKFLSALACRLGSEPCTGPFPTLVQQYGLAELLQACVFYLFGVGYYQSAVLAAALGILSVWVIWRTGRLMVNEEYGLALAFLLATSLWHIAFSRHSDIEHSLPVLQAVVSIYCSIMFAKSPTLLKGAILGIVIGSSWYVYATNQVIPVLFIGSVPILCMTYRCSIRDRAWLAVLLGFAAVSYPAISVNISNGYFFPIRSTLPPTSNYTIGGASDFIRAVGKCISQIVVRSEDEWFVRAGGAITMAEKGLLLVGLVSIFTRMRSTLGIVQGAYVLGAFAVGLLPALISPEQAIRRKLLALVVTIFLEGLGALYIVRFGKLLGRAGAISLAVVFILAAYFSWREYAYHVRIPEVNSNRFYRSFATLTEQFAGTAPLTVVSTNPTSQGMARMHIEFAMTEEKRRAQTLDVSSFVTFRVLDEVTSSVDCRALCQPSGRIVMFESVLLPAMSKYFQSCPDFRADQIKAVTDFRGQPLVNYLQCL